MYERTCYYCGLSTNEKDHVIPRNMLKMIKDLDIEIRNKIMGKRILIIPSCRECNSLLSASYQNNLRKRKRELKRRLRKKYKKLLQIPSWSQYEIYKLGPTLKQVVQASCYHKKIIEERLKW